MISFLMKVAIAIIDLPIGQRKKHWKMQGNRQGKGIHLNPAIGSSGQAHLN
jgi:hypothetical protein